MNKNPSKTVVRCFVEEHDGAWQAFCIDFNLAAQGESAGDAKERLEAMILSYVEDAFGVDREHAHQLLNRRAPASIVARYYFLKAIDHAQGLINHAAHAIRLRGIAFEVFKEPVAAKRLAHHGS